MPNTRHSQYSQGDDKPIPEGDIGFAGVNNRLDPALLQPGECSVAINKRFTEGRAATRDGVRVLRWANVIVTTENDTVLPHTRLITAYQFKDPSTGIVWLLTADQITSSSVRILRFHESSAGSAVKGNQPAQNFLALVVGNWLVRANFIQGAGGVLIFQTEDIDGNYRTYQLTNMDEGFMDLASPSGSGTAMPGASFGIHVNGRFFIPNGADPTTGIATKDIVWVSDIFDHTQGSIKNELRINQGDDQDLVGLYKFNDTTIICGKERSMFAVSNIVGDTLDNLVLDPLTEEFGLASPKAFAQVGDEVWFLSNPRGVMAIYQTDNNKLRVRPVPKSNDLEKTIERINWKYAINARAVFHDNKFYLAVPIDDPEFAYPSFNNTATSHLYYTPPGEVYEWIKGDSTQTSLTVTSHPDTPFTASRKFRSTTQFPVLTVTSGAAVVGGLYLKEFNNAVLVYDAQTQKWAGHDESSGGAIMPREWVRVTSAGAERLAMATFDGYIKTYEDGPYDQHNEVLFTGATFNITMNSLGIADTFRSRGYVGKMAGTNWFDRVEFVLATWAPNWTCKVYTDGVNRVSTLKSNVTYDQTEYWTYHTAAWDFSNTNDDFHNPYRKDYAIKHATTATDINPGNNGLTPDLLAEKQQRLRTPRVRGRYIQIEITNSTGRCEVVNARAEAREGKRRNATQV